MLSHFKSVGTGYWWENYLAPEVQKAIWTGLSDIMAGGKMTPEEIGKSAEAAAALLRAGQ